MTQAEAAEPVVSICIPVFNRQDMIATAVQSALEQTGPAMEVVVIDNASSDQTWEVIRSLEHPALHPVRNSANLGLWGNMNRCLELARGRYVRILCSDDRLQAGTIARETALLDRHPQVALLSCPGRARTATGAWIGENGDHLRAGIYRSPEAIANLLWILATYGYNPLNFPSGILFRAAAMRQAGGFDERVRATGDFDYWLRLLQFGDLGIAAWPACEITVHGGSASHELYRSGDFMRGQFQVATRWRGVLERQRVRGAVERGLAARCLWHALRAGWRGEYAAARLYAGMPRAEGVAYAAAFWGLGRHLGYRLGRRLRLRCSRQAAQPWERGVGGGKE